MQDRSSNEKLHDQILKKASAYGDNKLTYTARIVTSSLACCHGRRNTCAEDTKCCGAAEAYFIDRDMK